MSISLALVLGALVAITLYKASDEFFSAKRKQTLVKTSELGNTSSGEVVFPIGSKVPNITFESISGSGGSYDMKKDLNTLKIVNFWASWCEPCVEEFSSFARLLGQLDGQVSFVGVSEDKTLKDAQDFLKAFDGDFKKLENVHFGYDTDNIYSADYGLLALPESFIVNADNKLVRRVSGFEQWDTKEAVGYFNKLIEDQKKTKKLRSSK
jgi:thiol-disulfide isomerase/thioredoxin